MPWINVIDENNATGELKEIYNKIKKERGKLSNIMKIHSLNPDAMKRHMELYISLMFGKSDLSREEREFIAVVVSKINRCEYCINHHKEALMFYWKNKEKLNRFLYDFNSVTLSKREHAILGYVSKLTRTPSDICKDDTEKLRNVGFTDNEILDVTLICSYFNFVNRIALGLGVEFSEEEVKGYNY